MMRLSARGARAPLQAVAAVALVIPLGGASARTANFVVEAPSAALAQQVADRAEVCRKQTATAWLGKELPPWPRPCPITVKLTDGEAGGFTTFGFSGGRVVEQSMSVEGRAERILASALPHEIAHTIFAAYLGGPMPRWADEGASLLNEDKREKDRHDIIVASLLARRADLPLSRLFRIEEYPRDLMSFYGQGYSVSRFLVEIGGRHRFLQFVRDGLEKGWDVAAHAHYGLTDVGELDRAWHAWHKLSVAARTGGDRVVVRAQSSP